MSARKVAGASMAVIALLAVWPGGGRAAAAAQTQTRDLRPGEPRPASRRETELVGMLLSGRATISLYLELATLQENRGAAQDAEATLTNGRAALPAEARLLTTALARLHDRTGRFDEGVRALEQAAAMAPSDASAFLVLATHYEEKVRKDPSLSPETMAAHVSAGLNAADRALAVNPDYVDAMVVKNILLRRQANLEANPTARAQLITEADQLRNRAIELQKARTLLPGNGPTAVVVGGIGAGSPGAATGAIAGGTPATNTVAGQAPIRVGGNIKTPTKLVDVRPVYPPEAQAAGVAGVVIMEVTIDTGGLVSDARVLRSIPALDQAAVDAVRQWQFSQTLLNGVPVPVIMTVTVNFTIQ